MGGLALRFCRFQGRPDCVGRKLCRGTQVRLQGEGGLADQCHKKAGSLLFGAAVGK